MGMVIVMGIVITIIAVISIMAIAIAMVMVMVVTMEEEEIIKDRKHIKLRVINKMARNKMLLRLTKMISHNFDVYVTLHISYFL